MKKFRNLPLLVKWEIIRDVWLQAGGATALMLTAFFNNDHATSTVNAIIAWISAVLGAITMVIKRRTSKRNERSTDTCEDSIAPPETEG